MNTEWRKQFPILRNNLIYLDNASTTLKPQSVIDAINEYYTKYSVNVHRGIYELSEHASQEYEAVRTQVQQFIGAAAPEEIIFTSGTTHSLNLAARLLAQQLEKGDEIILTRVEHHANIIPWQLVAAERGCTLKYLELNDNDEIDPEELSSLISPRSKILALTHMSNASGYIPPVRELIDIAHNANMLVVLDAAQSVPHMPTNVQELDCDLLAFSAHKMYGPTGTGVLYGKRALLEQCEPVFGGGSMIDEVYDQRSTWAPLPLKFEPGTPNIAGVIGLGAAITFVESIGIENSMQHEQVLTNYALDQLEQIDEITVRGPLHRKTHGGIISFVSNTIHPHDIATILDQEHIAVRAGHHCAQPLMRAWNIPATTRISFALYNTTAEIDALVAGIAKAQQRLKK